MQDSRIQRLGPGLLIVAWRLTEGRCVSPDELIVALYGNREDGGPNQARVVIRELVQYLRRILRPQGIEIWNVHGRGYFVQASQTVLLRSLLAEEIASFAYPAQWKAEYARRLALRKQRRDHRLPVETASHEATVNA